MMKVIDSNKTVLAGILGCVLMSACSETIQEKEQIGLASQPLVNTSWEDVSSSSLTVTGNASATVAYGGWLNVFYPGTQGSTFKIIEQYYDGANSTWWSPNELAGGQAPTHVSATSCGDGTAESLWLVSNARRIAPMHFSDPPTWTSLTDIPGITPPIRGYTAVSWTGDCWWYSMFYLNGSDGVLKHKWYDKNAASWSGEEVLTDPNGTSISGVDPNYSPKAMFDGTAIRIFYVRASDHKIKVRDFPYNGDWGKVSTERCTGQTIDAGGSFGVAWDGTHKIGGVPSITTTGTAYLLYRRSGSTDIGVNYSPNYAQGSWFSDSSYTLQAGHNCVSGYSAISFRPGKVEVFCNTSTGRVRHGTFNSFG